MKPEYAADVGNTRIKWAGPEGVVRWPHDPKNWGRLPPGRWAIGGAVPEVVRRFADHARAASAEVLVIESHRQIPIEVDVRFPPLVGLDRLFDAVAAASRTPDALIVDAGTAVTIDRISCGVFRGGAILPGFFSMAKVLHETTAKLPMVDCTIGTGEWPGRDTEAAIRAGVIAAVVGAVERLARSSATVFVTGGDGPFLAARLGGGVVEWPNMTLDGIALSANAAG